MAGRYIKDFIQHLRSLGAIRQAAGLGDDALVDRFVRDRDQAAFEALLGRHGPLVWTVCRRLLSDPGEAEDAFQATWLVFVRRAHTIRRPRQVANWLYGVAHKVAARSRSKSFRRQALQQGDPAAAAIPAPDPTAAETARILHEELDALPLAYRAPLVLCYLQGHRQEEAAAMLGCSTGSIHGRLERGRHRLRSRLERRGVGLTVAGLAATLEPEAGAATLPAALARNTTAAVVSFLTDPQMAHEALRAPAVILTDGVCRTMQLAKFKIIALCVLAASLIGGAGLFAGRSDGPAAPSDPPPKGQQPPLATRPPVLSPNSPPASNTWQLDWVHDQQEAEVLEKKLEEQEASGSRQLRDERKALLLSQERLRQLEQRAKERHRREGASLQVAEAHVLNATQRVEKLESDTKPDSPQLQEARTELAAATKRRVLLEEAQRVRDESFTMTLVNAKLAVMSAQDSVHRVEQQLERQHQNILADLKLIQQRIRQARWGAPPTMVNPQVQLEQKVDELTRQIDALRRELHQESGAATLKSRSSR